LGAKREQDSFGKLREECAHFHAVGVPHGHEDIQIGYQENNGENVWPLEHSSEIRERVLFASRQTLPVTGLCTAHITTGLTGAHHRAAVAAHRGSIWIFWLVIGQACLRSAAVTFENSDRRRRIVATTFERSLLTETLKQGHQVVSVLLFHRQNAFHHAASSG